MDIKGTRDSLNVVDSNVAESRFTNVKLANSSFTDVNLQGSTFSDVNLRGGKFSDVNLTNVAIEQANMDGMSIDGMLVSDLIRAYKRRTRIVLYAKNLSGVHTFYQSVLGLALDEAHVDHVLLASHGLELVIVKVPESIASTIDITVPPMRRSGTPIKPVFDVVSIRRARENAPALGGEVYDPSQEWAEGAYRYCDGQDPEGNVIQFREREPAPAF